MTRDRSTARLAGVFLVLLGAGIVLDGDRWTLGALLAGAGAWCWIAARSRA